MAKKHTREMQIKASLRYQDQQRLPSTANAGEDPGERKASLTVGWIANWPIHPGNQCEESSEE